MRQHLSILLLMLFTGLCVADETTPVLYKGRIRPFCCAKEAAAPSNDQEYLEAYRILKQKQLNPNEIGSILESQFPLRSRIEQHRGQVNYLPLKHNPTHWVSLPALQLNVYNPRTDRLEKLGNFTAYSDAIFQAIQSHYPNDEAALDNALKEGYQTLAGKPMLAASGKTLRFPTQAQLLTEYYVSRFPFIELIIIFYIASIPLFFTRYKKIALICSFAGFFFQTTLIALRCYILSRPPVSNMYETMLYVPWITMIAAYLLWWRYRIPLVIPASAGISSVLLVMQLVIKMDSGMENVQAVLDSRMWLIIHVLLVVGSYGLFILSGLFGHCYLVLAKWKQNALPTLSKLILQTMYIGTAMLICGTVLGGVWAAQSWGRFWDWDPKESWAFISSCIYLLWIHAYRFSKIGAFGLAVGSVIGLHAIIFTWYGVNYILGTGMHSYGFGSGGEVYYYGFLAGDLLFLGGVGLYTARGFQ